MLTNFRLISQIFTRFQLTEATLKNFVEKCKTTSEKFLSFTDHKFTFEPVHLNTWAILSVLCGIESLPGGTRN